VPLLDQPGFEIRFADEVIFVEQQDGPDPDVDEKVMTAVSDGLICWSEKIPAGRAYITGKGEFRTNWRIYVDHTPGATFPYDEKQFLWHSKGSDLNADGTPNLWSSLIIQSIVTNDTEGIATIEAARTR